jgi:hypothetical protein
VDYYKYNEEGSYIYIGFFRMSDALPANADHELLKAWRASVGGRGLRDSDRRVLEMMMLIFSTPGFDGSVALTPYVREKRNGEPIDLFFKLTVTGARRAEAVRAGTRQAGEGGGIAAPPPAARATSTRAAAPAHAPVGFAAPSPAPSPSSAPPPPPPPAASRPAEGGAGVLSGACSLPSPCQAPLRASSPSAGDAEMQGSRPGGYSVGDRRPAAAQPPERPALRPRAMAPPSEPRYASAPPAEPRAVAVSGAARRRARRVRAAARARSLVEPVGDGVCCQAAADDVFYDALG